MSAIQIIASLVLFSSTAFATAFDVPVQTGDRLILNGLNAQVTFVGKGTESLKVSGAEKEGSEGTYVIEKRNGIISIKMKEFDGKKAWLGALKSGVVPTVKIEITGPSVPSEVYLKSGQVIAKQWTQSLKINLTVGKVSTSDTKGELSIFLQKGDVQVSSHQGQIAYDLYSGSGSLKNLEGRLKVNQFEGALAVEKMKGSLNLASSKATVSILQGSGNIEFDAQKGSVTLKGFQGRVEGKSQDSKIVADMTLDSEFDVKTKSGNVAISTPAAGAFDLNLLTVEGEIQVPGTLRVNKLSSEKSVRGKLRSDASRGSIFVRSQEGTISVK